NCSFSFILIFSSIYFSQAALRRCYACRSRGDLGSCKDPFTLNSTLVADEKGVEAQPCASGWCGKIIEGESAFKEEYGTATQRMCLQRGPSDSEERCANTVWNYKKVYMCFCLGDLCNSAVKNTFTIVTMLPIVASMLLNKILFKI
ncbi:uncharacterized protein LOC123291624, partial [Chrysoperla carnea]|uniref:uncharacterized protein LOC123291624 n=1 Tax=Chrysoperla carnea TaxID=189513 RepID=UPI001D0752EF